MTLKALRIVLFAQPGATAEYPFDAETQVFKVGGKMFALLAQDETPLRITLKCDPDRAEILRATRPAIIPGYYMDKRHWNTLTLNGSIPDEETLDLIDHSYRLVVAGMTKAARAALLPIKSDKI